MDNQTTSRIPTQAESQTRAEEIISGWFYTQLDEIPEQPVDSQEHGGMGWLLG